MFFKTAVFLALSQLYAIESAKNCHGFHKHKNYPLLPHNEECRALRASPKIMGGHNAELGEFPWLAALFLNLSSLDIQLKWCTGSIISRKYVLTAAHCMPPDLVELYDVLVRVGEHDLLTERDCDVTECAPPTVTYNVEKYIRHPEYDTDDSNNDLGLIRVKGRFQWNDYVYPVCLPMSCYLIKAAFEGKPLIVAGFGALIDAPETVESRVLQKVTLYGANRYKCGESYGKVIKSTQICVGGSDNGGLNKDACRGDSGGPLIYNSPQTGSSARPVLVGVVSSGENCTVYRISNAPGIYTRVGSFVDWILDTIHK